MATALAQINSSMQEQLGLPVNAHLLNTAISMQSMIGDNSRYQSNQNPVMALPNNVNNFNNGMGIQNIGGPLLNNNMTPFNDCTSAMNFNGEGNRDCDTQSCEITFTIVVPPGGTISAELFRLMQVELKKEEMQERLIANDKREKRFHPERGVSF